MLTIAYRPSSKNCSIADGSDKLLGQGTSVGPVIDWKERSSVPIGSLARSGLDSAVFSTTRHLISLAHYTGERRDMPAYMLLSLWGVGLIRKMSDS